MFYAGFRDREEALRRLGKVWMDGVASRLGIDAPQKPIESDQPIDPNPENLQK